MNDTIETILALLVSVIVFFIFPIYIAYEKRDDLSYALASKYVSDFVEDVKVKGYISTKMYDELLAKLDTTGNTYDIYMEHKALKIYPYGKDGANGKFIEMQELYTEKQILDVIYKNEGSSNTSFYTPKYATNGEKVKVYSSEEINNLDPEVLQYIEQIKSKPDISKLPIRPTSFLVLSKNNVPEHIYCMNIGDEFNIRIINNNITIAAMLFDTFTTSSVSPNNTRVYINYGAIITAEKYWK